MCKSCDVRFEVPDCSDTLVNETTDHAHETHSINVNHAMQLTAYNNYVDICIRVFSSR